MHMVFSQVFPWLDSSFMLSVEYHSLVNTCLLSPSWNEGYLGDIHVSEIMNALEIMFIADFCVPHTVWIHLDKYQRLQLLVQYECLLAYASFYKK